jgi:hypothetical protein
MRIEHHLDRFIDTIKEVEQEIFPPRNYSERGWDAGQDLRN